MIEFLNFELFRWDTNNFVVWQLLLLMGMFTLTVFIHSVFRKLARRKFSDKALPEKFKRFVLRGIAWSLWVLFVFIGIRIVGVPLKTVLEFKIFASGDKVDISVTNLLAAIIVFFVIRIFLFLFEYFLDIRISDKRIDKGRGRSLMQIAKYLIWILGISIIISSLGFKVTFVIASVSALLVGVGFGLQGIFNDIFSGIIILFDGSIEVGDVVEVEGIVGQVKEIGIRASKILTRENVIMIIPNSKFTGDKVINWTHNDESTRFSVDIGVAYGSDVKLVEKILLECAAIHSMIVKKPEPFVRFNDFGESSLDFQLFFWTENDFLVENIKSDLRFEIDAKFRENKVEIPFPQRDLHLKSKNYS